MFGQKESEKPMVQPAQNTGPQNVAAAKLLTVSGDYAKIEGTFEIATSRERILVRVPAIVMPDVPKRSAGYFAAPGVGRNRIVGRRKNEAYRGGIGRARGCR